MRLVQRFDALPFSKARRTERGGFRVDGVVGKSGILRYKNPDGSERVEYRPPEEAFRADTLDSLRGAPVTLGHPPPGPSGLRLLDTSTYSKYTVGHASDAQPRREGDLLVTEITVESDAAVRAVERGDARELSLGYLAQYEEAPGVAPDGTRYDGVQRAVRINHVALVSRARAGHEAVLRLDGDGHQLPDDPDDPDDPEESQIMTVKIQERIDGALYDVDTDAHRAAVTRAQQANEARHAELVQLRAERDTAVAQAKQAQERLDAHEASFEARVASRVVLVATARARGVEPKPEMSDAAIKSAVLAKVLPALRLDGQSEEYINASFDTAMLAPATTAADLVKPAERTDSKSSDLAPHEQARQKAIGGRTPAWEKGN